MWMQWSRHLQCKKSYKEKSILVKKRGRGGGWGGEGRGGGLCPPEASDATFIELNWDGNIGSIICQINEWHHVNARILFIIYKLIKYRKILMKYNAYFLKSDIFTREKCSEKYQLLDSWHTAAVLCPWARHFTPRKYWLMTQEAVAPSRHDWKIVDWDVKPQHKQTNKIHDKNLNILYICMRVFCCCCFFCFFFVCFFFFFRCKKSCKHKNILIKERGGGGGFGPQKPATLWKLNSNGNICRFFFFY